MKRRNVLLGIAGILLAYNLWILVAIPAIGWDTDKPTPTTAAFQPKIPEISDIDPKVLLDETNAHRIKNGRKPLVLHEGLNQSAFAKCNDMVKKDYWSHIAPDGTEPWYFINQAKVVHRAAGENLADNYPSAQETVTAWTKSPGHNKNLLKREFDHVGFGICMSENYMDLGARVITVQHFIDK